MTNPVGQTRALETPQDTIERLQRALDQSTQALQEEQRLRLYAETQRAAYMAQCIISQQLLAARGPQLGESGPPVVVELQAAQAAIQRLRPALIRSDEARRKAEAQCDIYRTTLRAEQAARSTAVATRTQQDVLIQQQSQMITALQQERDALFMQLTLLNREIVELQLLLYTSPSPALETPGSFRPLTSPGVTPLEQTQGGPSRKRPRRETPPEGLVPNPFLPSLRIAGRTQTPSAFTLRNRPSQ
jgi:hypothetical protein